LEKYPTPPEECNEQNKIWLALERKSHILWVGDNTALDCLNIVSKSGPGQGNVADFAN